jgi:hypothetical protein
MIRRTGVLTAEVGQRYRLSVAECEHNSRAYHV